MYKVLGEQVVRIYRGMAIVKNWGKYVDESGKPYGDLRVFYDICDYKDGEVGDRHVGFVTYGAAIKRLFM